MCIRDRVSTQSTWGDNNYYGYNQSPPMQQPMTIAVGPAYYQPAVQQPVTYQPLAQPQAYQQPPTYLPGQVVPPSPHYQPIPAYQQAHQQAPTYQQPPAYQPQPQPQPPHPPSYPPQQALPATTYPMQMQPPPPTQSHNPGYVMSQPAPAPPVPVGAPRYPMRTNTMRRMENLLHVGVNLLSELSGFYVLQQVNARELHSDEEFPNTYDIYPIDSKGEKMGNHIFRAFEVNKNRYSQGAFRINVRALDDEGRVRHDMMTIGRLSPNDNMIEVLRIEGVRQVIGHIELTNDSCRYTVNIRGPRGEQEAIISADQMQCSLLCGGCFRETDFVIYNREGNRVSTMDRIVDPEIRKISDADCYSLTFPKNANPNERLLFLAAAIVIDFVFFETTQ
eukprot:TRINITY_DN13440_c0_g1_i2.p1 TRINITY_DN13440_c0_g1~~TRINITY_DN13440_c0_g1_i2.p1  ORF type:complete len:391 (+),score=69.42 TRINITY_DN13440_c0_g1_i2:64-1236(+)